MKSDLKGCSELRRLARERLRGNWTVPVLVCVFISLVYACAPSMGKFFAIYIVTVAPITAGVYKYFLKFGRNEEASIETIFDGFKLIKSSISLYFVTNLFILLWGLLFIIPGIIASFRYSMAFFILNDNPEAGAMEAFKNSKKMMNGHKGNLFLLYLSFIGWFLLSCLTLGIGFIWLIPYVKLTLANFYYDLKENM